MTGDQGILGEGETTHNYTKNWFKKKNRKEKGKKKQTSSRMAPVADPSDRSQFLPNSPLSKSLVFSKWSVAPEEAVIPAD